jgi:PAS domain S-box-containing protein
MACLILSTIVLAAIILRTYSVIRELRQKEVFFRAIIEHSTDFVFQVIKDHNVIYVNGPTEEILGVAKSTLLKKPWYSFIEKSDQIVFEKYLSEAEAQPDKTIHIDRIRLKNSDSSTAYCEGRILYSTDLHSFIVNWRHITDRVLAEQELLRTKRDLQTAIQLVTDGMRTRTEIRNASGVGNGKPGDSRITKSNTSSDRSCSFSGYG